VLIFPGRATVAALSWMAALTAATLLLLAGLPSTALAQSPECAEVDLNLGTCIIKVEGPGTPAQPVNNPGSGRGGGSGGPACVGYGGASVPCDDPLFGTWSNALECYLKRANPQPDAASPLWGGRYPEGAVYECVATGAGPFTEVARIWLPQAPEVAMRPEQAAQIVVRRMDLRAADIGIVPEDEPGRIGAVGAPVYMWTTPGPTTFGPQTLTGSAGGVTITATAKVDRVVWSMGDGTSVTCRTPGTVYEDRFGFRDSPDCGHRYTRTSAGKPGNAYPISATSFWVVDWTGPAGSSGQITLDLVSSTSIAVGELQALVTR
jgi:hypothetical protein